MAGPRVAPVAVVLLCAFGVTAGAQVAPRTPAASNNGLLVDPANGCGTSNPIPRLGETIRWQGGCQDGLLDGQGTLMWFQDGKIREKNEGNFAAGELEGQAITTFADGSMIIGNYSNGVRHGEFIIRRTSGSNVRALYSQGKLISERELSDQELRAFRDGKYQPTQVETTSAAQAVAAAPATTGAAMVAAAPVAIAAATQPQAAAPSVPWSAQANGAPQVAAAAAPARATQSDVVVPWSPRAYGTPAALAAGTAVAAAAVPAPAPPPVAVVPTPATFQSPPPMSPQVQGAPVAGQRVAGLGGPDQALNEAMLLERAGRNTEAAGLYADIATVAGSTPTGMLAAERAAKLRAPGDRPVPYQNAPLPLQGTTALANPAERAPLNGKFVCSAADLFANNANWCGRVLREEGNDVEVEIRSIRFNRLFAIGFSSAPCTGGRFLGPFAEGTKIWVSRGCLEGNP